MVDWRGFGTEQWGGAGIPVADTPRPRAVETPLPGAPTPKAPPEPAPSADGSAAESAATSTTVEEEPTPADGVPAAATPRALVSEAEASFLRERIEQHERSIDRLEQLVARAQELQLTEQRSHEETRRQLSEAQERVVRLLEAPRPEPAAPAASAAGSTAADAEPAAPPLEPPPELRETGSAEAVTRDVRRGLGRLSRWMRG